MQCSPTLQLTCRTASQMQIVKRLGEAVLVKTGQLPGWHVDIEVKSPIRVILMQEAVNLFLRLYGKSTGASSAQPRSQRRVRCATMLVSNLTGQDVQLHCRSSAPPTSTIAADADKQEVAKPTRLPLPRTSSAFKAAEAPALLLNLQLCIAQLVCLKQSRTVQACFCPASHEHAGCK